MKKRENWVDHVKVAACILVALGHMLQGLLKAGILENNALLDWFIQTIYSFHVQLFFICSGYLYQKYSAVDNFKTWKDNSLKKLLALGIPYIVFSVITWGLKKVFSGTVNGEVSTLWYDLFVVPQSPYWYLYTLFFVFLITPTFRSGKACIIGVVGAVLIRFVPDFQIYAVSQTVNYEIWFVLGMAVCFMNVPAVAAKWKAWAGVLLAVLFGSISVVLWMFDFQNHAVSIAMGLIACAGVFLIAVRFEEKQNKWARYTMPVFLMHTIFAAGFRAILMKVGITNGPIHIVVGIVASFLFPVLAAVVMRWLRLDFVIYPNKFLPMKK